MTFNVKEIVSFFSACNLFMCKQNSKCMENFWENMFSPNKGKPFVKSSNPIWNIEWESSKTEIKFLITIAYRENYNW